MPMSAILRAGTLALVLILTPGIAAGHGADGGGFPSKGGPREAVPEPEDDDTIESSAWFGDYNNEQPEQVELYLEKVRAQKDFVHRAGHRSEAAGLDAKVRRLELRKEIATRRQQRDALKRKGDTGRAGALEREIHALKARFEAAAGTGSKGKAVAKAEQHDAHGH